jgi:hypothetical protein
MSRTFTHKKMPTEMRRIGGTIAATAAATAMMTAAALLTAASALSATPGPDQSAGSNITVTNCHVQLDNPPLRIGYTNDAAATATEVDFAVVGSVGLIATVRDIGTFVKGTPISHVFRLPADTSPLGLSSARCVVAKVVYADGTTWANPRL